MSRLGDIERARLLDQLTEAERLAEAYPRAESPDEALQFAAAQMRRNASQLRAATQGRTPSAVVDRTPRHPDDDDAERLALARDEAAHTADNVLAFIDRDEPNAPTRCARWLLRLRLELLDALPQQSASAEALALRLLRCADPDRDRLRQEIRSAMERWLEALRA